jgi:hypothetical protein
MFLAGNARDRSNMDARECVNIPATLGDVNVPCRAEAAGDTAVRDVEVRFDRGSSGRARRRVSTYLEL